jgi:acetyltransferase-like isoleucine patch superfamily enzyme
MALQGGQIKRIRIEDDVWIGVQCVIADDVGTGSIIAIGTVVTSPVPEFTLAIGNPARLLPRP